MDHFMITLWTSNTQNLHCFCGSISSPAWCFQLLKWLSYAQLFCMDQWTILIRLDTSTAMMIDWCAVCVFHYPICSSMAALAWKTTVFHSCALVFNHKNICFFLWIAPGDIVICETVQSGPQTTWKHTNLQLNRWWIHNINRTNKLTHHQNGFPVALPGTSCCSKDWPPSDWCLDLACVHVDCCGPPRRPSPWNWQ